MNFNSDGYRRAISTELTIIDKNKMEVQFVPNKAQDHFLDQLGVNQMLVVLKARKMGFSSVALAIAVLKFLLGKNERCVSMSFDATASGKQLERAKHFIRAFEMHNGVKIPFKYNTKQEMVYEGIDEVTGRPFVNTLRVGTARNGSFGRGDDITFLHLTEVAFCENMDELLTGVLQAVVNNSPVIFETTANGYNDFKTFFDRVMKGETTFLGLFYGPEWEYTLEFLEAKKKELGERLFKQEYPATAEEAFLTSGECYFDVMVLEKILAGCSNPIALQI